MAVFTHAYEGFSGEVTPRSYRPLVIFRYALANLFESRLFAVFYTLCFLPSAVVMVMIYMHYNLEILIQLDLRLDDLVRIDSAFFAGWMQGPQMAVAFVLVMVIGPTLVSPDLGNNALSLYLSRPISRTGYVVGKLLVLLVLGSLITWIPALGLVLFQTWLAGGEWLSNHLHLLIAPVMVSLTWLVTLSMVSLAISAWVKWKVISRMFFFGLFFFTAGLENAIEGVFGGWVGSLIHISHLAEAVISFCYDTTAEHTLPATAAATALVIYIGLSAFMLSRRIRAFEVSG